VNGQRGNCEIGTGLLHWFQSLSTTVKEVSLFSDTCSGQNRTQYIAALFINICQNYHFQVLEHKFLEKGHTHMQVDSILWRKMMSKQTKNIKTRRLFLLQIRTGTKIPTVVGIKIHRLELMK
jgi:hypothetical protein